MSTQKQAFDAQFNKIINGKNLEFVYHNFKNKIFIIITEFPNISNFYTVQFDAVAIPSNASELFTPLTIIHNFGADTDECRSAVEFLTKQTKLKTLGKEILFNLGLKDINGPMLKEIACIIDSNILK